MANHTYHASTPVPDYSTAKTIADAARAWCQADADREFHGFAYDEVNLSLRVTLRVENIDDIPAYVTNLNGGIDSLNTNHGTDLPTVDEGDLNLS